MGINWGIIKGLFSIAEITAKQLAELKWGAHVGKYRMVKATGTAAPMSGIRLGKIAISLAMLLGLLQGCKAPLQKEMLDSNGESLGFGSTIRFLVETRASADPLDRKLVKSIIDMEIAEYERFNPGVKIQTRYVSRDSLRKEVQFQYSRGLAPDLILLTTNNILPLKREGFIRPLSLRPFELNLIRPSLLPAFKNKGILLGIPVFIYPQIACFNRAKLENPPENIEDLIKLGQAGKTIGIYNNFVSLQWLYSGLSGNLFEPKPNSSSLNFLRWLRLANLQPTISFESDPGLLRDGLISGQFSWITCQSYWLGSLEKRMGSRLGITQLPNLPNGPAQPLLEVRTWVFGSQSSGRQYELAKRFALFSINIVQQRNMALKLGNSVPINPGISLPLKSDSTLAIVDSAATRGKLLHLWQIDWLEKITPQLTPYVDLVISGAQSPETMAPKLNLLLAPGLK
jgi:ABC-type glycerol-3-phosphate transport system substrate-binding protein